MSVNEKKITRKEAKKAAKKAEYESELRAMGSHVPTTGAENGEHRGR